MAKSKNKETYFLNQSAIGKYFLIIDVTSMIYIGELVSIDGPHTVTLKDASWVSETGRLADFMRDGTAENMEIEPVGVQGCHWAGWRPWTHPLLTEQI
jgi:hypothetical protein